MQNATIAVTVVGVMEERQKRQTVRPQPSLHPSLPQAHTHTHAHTRTHTHTHAHPHTPTHMYTHTHLAGFGSCQRGKQRCCRLGNMRDDESTLSCSRQQTVALFSAEAEGGRGGGKEMKSGRAAACMSETSRTLNSTESSACQSTHRHRHRHTPTRADRQTNSRTHTDSHTSSPCRDCCWPRLSLAFARQAAPHCQQRSDPSSPPLACLPPCCLRLLLPQLLCVAAQGAQPLFVCGRG